MPNPLLHQRILDWYSALRLRSAATAIVDQHRGRVPESREALLALPGVGTYTAAAVASFAFGLRETVLDTNVRRVLARLHTGAERAAPLLTRAETDLATRLLPADAQTTRRWNIALMELGALVCTARSPRCPDCPVQDVCAWQRGGQPAYEGPGRRKQDWQGSDRQCRGAILATLRDTTEPVTADAVRAAWTTDNSQRSRCLDSLVADGLVEPLAGNRFRLPGSGAARVG